MKIIFFGLGSIGQRHLRLLQKYYDFDIYAFRSSRKRKPVAGVKEIYTWKEVDEIEPDVAFITNPTYLHLKTALSCAKRRMKLFIEKPIDKDLALLGAVQEYCKDIPTYVAYPFRYNYSTQKLKEKIARERVYHARFVCSTYLPGWRSYQTYSAYAVEGGGALLDLSHEIDLAVYLFGNIKNIIGAYSQKSDVTADAEDCADLIVKHEYGITSNIHLDLYSKDQKRYVEITTENGCYRVDYRQDDEMYIEQLRYFFNNIDNPRMMNNIHKASGMFRKLIEFKESSNE